MRSLPHPIIVRVLRRLVEDLGWHKFMEYAIGLMQEQCNDPIRKPTREARSKVVQSLVGMRQVFEACGHNKYGWDMVSPNHEMLKVVDAIGKEAEVCCCSKKKNLKSQAKPVTTTKKKAKRTIKKKSSK